MTNWSVGKLYPKSVKPFLSVQLVQRVFSTLLLNRIYQLIFILKIQIWEFDWIYHIVYTQHSLIYYNTCIHHKSSLNYRTCKSQCGWNACIMMINFSIHLCMKITFTHCCLALPEITRTIYTKIFPLSCGNVGWNRSLTCALLYL